MDSETKEGSQAAFQALWKAPGSSQVFYHMEMILWGGNIAQPLL